MKWAQTAAFAVHALQRLRGLTQTQLGYLKKKGLRKKADPNQTAKKPSLLGIPVFLMRVKNTEEKDFGVEGLPRRNCRWKPSAACYLLDYLLDYLLWLFSNCNVQMLS